MRDFFDGPVSVIEELDPEPEPTGRWLHLREFILGFLLLLGVVAWSSWQWWQQDQQQANYSIAQQATADQDWDRALQYFNVVKGFKDADSRASEMNKLVTERNTQYEIASSSAEKGQWAATLKAAQAVRRVQRDYRDTSQLEAQASWEVYKGALQGVVALRTQGRKPALYYRGLSSWQWLPRSDQYSQKLLTLDASGAILYDVPGENWDQVKLTPTATAAPTSIRVPGKPELRGRALQVARYGRNDGTAYFGVNFDPSEYNYYWIGENGMWAIRQDNNRIGKRPRVMMGYGAILVDYQAFGSSKPVKVAVQPDWTYVDFAPDGEHILLVKEGPTLDLYVADGTGGNKKLLYSHDGSIQGVQFSPDSKYALLTAYSYKPGGTETYKAVLIDIASGQTFLLAERSTTSSQQRLIFPMPLAGAFLRDGPFKGYALISEYVGERARVYLFAPGNPTSPAVQIEVEKALTSSVWVSSKGESTLLAWTEQTGSFGSAGALHLLEIKPDKSAVETTLPVEGKGFLAFSGIRDDWFLYGGREYGGGGGRPNLYSIFALPYSGLAKQEKMPEPLYREGLPDVSGYPFARAIYPGPSMLSYLANGEMHVRTYDGAVDLTLENGVLHLYDPMFNAAWVQLR